ncbi:MAG: PIG-L family deacetylase [Opitutales bacterium]
MSKSPEAPPTILALGAHPDDIEFGCGGVLLQAAARRSAIHLLVCTKGEAASHGSPLEREAESQVAAGMLGAQLRFLALEGDSHLEPTVDGAVAMARILREVRPAVLLAPTAEPNQHPDHVAVARMARDAARLARYGGLDELSALAPHAIRHLLHYAITPGAEPARAHGIRIDISSVREAWEELMRCHGSQMGTRPYVDLQLARARTWGLEGGVAYAQALFPADPLVFGGIDELGGAARAF